jgi:ankyrin repeat protein
MRYFKRAFYLIVFIGYSVSFAGSYDDFFSALERDNATQVQGLLARGFDPNSVGPDGQYALVLALRKSSLAVARLLIAHPATRVEVRTIKDESPLMLAALKGEIGI